MFSPPGDSSFLNEGLGAQPPTSLSPGTKNASRQLDVASNERCLPPVVPVDCSSTFSSS